MSRRDPERCAAGASGARFWEEKSLEAMSDAEWEALCDRCGRCCLQKLEDEDSGRLQYTRVACRLLDVERGCCARYAERRALVEDCLSVRPLTAEKLSWLPPSCAYRRLAEGRGLADWHPLIAGDRQEMRRRGIAVDGRVVSERDVPPEAIVLHLVDWPEGEPVSDRERSDPPG